MKTLKKTSKAKLIETKAWGYEVIDYTSLVNGRPSSMNFGRDLKSAEKKYEDINS